jgi:hypothetical protein
MLSEDGIMPSCLSDLQVWLSNLVYRSFQDPIFIQIKYQCIEIMNSKLYVSFKDHSKWVKLPFFSCSVSSGVVRGKSDEIQNIAFQI